MKYEIQKIIFLNSYLPRTGHNFASELIKVFTDHQVLIHNKSETRLSKMLNDYYKIYNETIFHKTDKVFFDKLFIVGLRNRILKESSREFLMIKDRTIVSTPHLLLVFPDDIHLILIRDPKNVFNSLVKGMQLGKPFFKNTLKKIGNRIGFYPWYYSRKLSKQILNEMPDLKLHQIIRYKDLIEKKRTGLMDLKKMFGIDKSLNQIKKEIDEIRVINSSFYEQIKGKKIWDAQHKSKNFDPINPKSNNWLIRKCIELGNRKLRKKLNYI